MQISPLEDIFKDFKLHEAYNTTKKCKDGKINKEDFGKLANNILGMNQLIELGIRFGTGVAISI